MAFVFKYRIDFQMFVYDISDYLKYASESEGLMPDAIDVSDLSDSVSENMQEEEFYDENTSETTNSTEP